MRSFSTRLAGIVFGLLAMASLSACAGGPRLSAQDKNLVVSVVDSLPAPKDRAVPDAATPYVVGPFDRLRVEVYNVPELQQTVRADANGRFGFPLIGMIDALGKTPEELAADIASRLRPNYVRNPQVTVNLEEIVSKTFVVDGQVQKPGVFPALGKVTLVRAIASAGGTSEFAQLEDVIVFRTVGDQKYAGVYNLGAIRRGQYADPEVYADDVIFVGDSPARRRFKDLIQAAPLLTTPLLLIFRN